MPPLPLYIGCPVWNCDGWSDVVYPAGTKRPQWLNWYTQMFNCVEGNSSFYAIPTIENARRWAAEAAPGFRFCMKFPREISHDRALMNCESPTAQFLAALEQLAAADRLGPTFLQLGPHFAADRFEALSNYLGTLPREFPWAVEVRHLSWFDSALNESKLNDLLAQLRIDKVIFDSRPLNQAPAEDDSEKQAQQRKPKSPSRTTATGQHPMLRLIGRNHVEQVDSFFNEWTPQIVQWVTEGRTPYIFAHTPDDTFAPAMARRFWDNIRAQLTAQSSSDLQPLPTPPRKPRQLDLLL